jgi:hypothetical protein
MMMELSGIMFMGTPLEIVLMFASGVFYVICAALIWKPFRRERNELIGALFAFLVYQAIAMILMGMEMFTHVMMYSTIGSLAIFIGSVYMLKFPFSYFGVVVRKILFVISMLAAFALFGWFVSSPEREMELMHFILWYDLVINGLIVGLFMISAGLRSPLGWFKTKAIGGGAGVATCCVAANAAMISGALIMSSVFQFIAPVLIVGSLAAGRKMQQRN